MAKMKHREMRSRPSFSREIRKRGVGLPQEEDSRKEAVRLATQISLQFSTGAH